MVTWPASGSRSPARVRSRVLLPAPLRPITLQHSPALMAQFKLSTSVRVPAFKFSWSVRIIACSSTLSSTAQAVQLVQEDGRAYHCRDDADGQLQRRQYGARQGVGQYQESATCQGGGRDQQSMVGAAGKAQRMRHDQADEAHAAGAGNGAGRQQTGTKEQ